MRGLLVAVGAALLCGTALAADDDTLYIRSAMQGPVNQATATLWDIGNNAMDDEGGIDPAQMDAAKWARLETASAALEAEARRMAGAAKIRAAQPGDDHVEPGAYAMADVQRYLDADPQAFRLLAKALGDHAAKISAAAKAREAKQAGLLVGELDQVCESCHAHYWYPEG